MKNLRRFALLPIFAFSRGVSFLLGLLSRGSKAKHLPETLRLYRRTREGTEFLWVYENGDRIHFDVGLLGQMATRENYDIADWPAIEEHIRRMLGQGFTAIDPEDMQFFQITYKVAGDFAEGAEFDKRNALLDKLDEFFALTGQGYWCDASSGSGTMELGFDVVDFEIAELTVRSLLAGTEYADFLAVTPFPRHIAPADDPVEILAEIPVEIPRS